MLVLILATLVKTRLYSVLYIMRQTKARVQLFVNFEYVFLMSHYVVYFSLLPVGSA